MSVQEPFKATSQRPSIQMSKRCFVVCPIGPKDSEIRRASDDAFELLIEPALEIFRFNVIRADKIMGSGHINLEVIELVQNAELCIIDLSEANPNVYYEAGRRHETAKPFIQIVREDVELPFDLAGVRTIQYNLNDARSTYGAVQDIRRHVQAFEDASYSSSSSGFSMVTLAQAVDRIDRKLDRLSLPNYSAAQAAAYNSAGVGVPTRGLQDLLANPSESFMDAVTAGDTPRAVAAINHLMRLKPGSQEVIAYAGLLAAQGVPEGASAVRSILDASSTQDFKYDNFQAGVSALVRFYTITDTETDGVTEIESLIEPKLSDANVGHKDKAYLVNQLQMMHWGAQDYARALENGTRAIELDPEEPAYKYNVSMIHEALEQYDEAEALVDEYMASEQSQNDASHLSQAIDIYIVKGRINDVRSCFEKLSSVDPAKASRKVMLDRDLLGVLEA